MSISIHPDPVPLRVDEQGTIRIGKTRITLDVLLDDHRAGLTPEQIVEQMDTLTLSDVHGALAYYYRHRAELDEYLRVREEEAARLEKSILAANADFHAELKARVEALRATKDAAHAASPE